MELNLNEEMYISVIEKFLNLIKIKITQKIMIEK